jgi:hypothetical protein
VSAYDANTPTKLTGQFGEEYEVYTVTTGGPTYTVTFICQSDETPTAKSITTVTTPRPVALTEQADGRLDAWWRDDAGTGVVQYKSFDRGDTWAAGP